MNHRRDHRRDRRHRRPNPSKPRGQRPHSVFLISYWPGYDPRTDGYTPGQNIYDSNKHPTDPTVATQQLETIFRKLEQLPTTARACLWANSDSGPAPILVMENAQAIAHHIKHWSDDNPQDWFQLIIEHDQHNPTRYCVLLHPIIAKTVERYKAARLAYAEEITPANTTYQVIYHPLCFGTDGSTTYRDTVMNKLPPVDTPMEFGIADPAIMDHLRAGDSTAEVGHLIHAFDGKYRVKRGAPDSYREYVASFLSDLKAPAGGTSHLWSGDQPG